MDMIKKTCGIFYTRICSHQINFTRYSCYLVITIFCSVCFYIQAAGQLKSTNKEVKPAIMKAAAEDRSHIIYLKHFKKVMTAYLYHYILRMPNTAN